MSALGIIGGTGLTQLQGLRLERRQSIATPWGEPSAPLMHGRLEGHAVVFLPRHGTGHTLAPHEVNYRANLWALGEAGVTHVIAVNAVGGIGGGFPPGSLVIPHDLIDYSWGRAHTFFEGEGTPLRHVDFTAPYDAALRALLLAAARRVGLAAHDGGVYAVTQGPRLETAAEVDRLARDGCDIVGMTGMPEAGLARELELSYACLAVVVNRAAGRGADIHGEFEQWVETGMAQALKVIAAVFGEMEKP